MVFGGWRVPGVSGLRCRDHVVVGATWDVNTAFDLWGLSCLAG